MAALELQSSRSHVLLSTAASGRWTTWRVAALGRAAQVLANGHDWFERLISGKAKSLMEIAEKDGVDSNYVTRVINLSFLAPDIIRAIIEGRQPTTVTADTIMDQFPLPIDWADQRKLLGFRH
jgi:site-specific DNA recombinase